MVFRFRVNRRHGTDGRTVGRLTDGQSGRVKHLMRSFREGRIIIIDIRRAGRRIGSRAAKH